MKMWYALNFREWAQLITDDPNREAIGEKSKQIMVLSIYKAMVELKKAWLFTDEDIQELTGKFILNMEVTLVSLHANGKPCIPD